MARGRMINTSICMDKQVHLLSDDTSRLAFTWLITHADREGRTYGDPAMVWSMLFPRREEKDTERMERYLQEWHDAGLIVWYEAGGDRYVWFPSFDKNQAGLRKDREAPSTFPPPSAGVHPEQCRSTDGVTPAERKGRERKGKELKGTEGNTLPPPLAAKVSAFMLAQTGGQCSSRQQDDVTELVDADVPFEWLTRAGEIADERGQKTGGMKRWGYIMGIIRSWQTNGYDGDRRPGNGKTTARASPEPEKPIYEGGWDVVMEAALRSEGRL